MECDDVLIAVGQENAFPWIERDIGIAFDKWGMPVVDKVTFQSSLPNVLFGGDSAFGPKNIIWAVAHGHEAAVSIDLLLRGEDVRKRPPPMTNLISQKMGIHEWSYDNDVALDLRYKVPLKEQAIALKDIKQEVELGFDPKLAFAEAQRCLNCDAQTVFSAPLCIECDACVDICPMDCITFTENGEESELRPRLTAPAPTRRRTSMWRTASRPDASWPRTRTSACIAGSAPSAARPAPGTCRSSRSTSPKRDIRHADRARKRFRRPVRQRQRLRFGEREPDLRARHPAHGCSGRAAQHLPLQHSGAADLVRGAGLRSGPSRGARRHRSHGGDEPADLGQGCRRDRARRVSLL